jgi:hypothetical protein
MERDALVAVKEAQRIVSGLADVDLGALTDSEVGRLVLEAQRLQSMAAALTARAMGTFDAKVGWAGDDEQSPSLWLTARARCSHGRAKRVVAAGRALRHLPAVAAAFEQGDIGEEQVALLAQAWRFNPDAFARDTQLLLRQAAEHQFWVFRKAVKYWQQINDPDEAENEAVDRYQRRKVFLSTTFEDMGRLDGDLTPTARVIVGNELQRLEQELFEADRAAARAEHGDRATKAHLGRTAAQRRHDALVEMATRSAAMPPDARRPRPLFSAHVDHPTLAGRICELADGTVVTPGEILPYLCDCDIERVVFDGPSRVIDIGVKQRLFTGATRRSVEVKDLHCQGHPACKVPADRCDVDHDPVPYAQGGPTIQANGRLKCPRHHPGRRKNRPRPPPDDD